MLPARVDRPDSFILLILSRIEEYILCTANFKFRVQLLYMKIDMYEYDKLFYFKLPFPGFTGNGYLFLYVHVLCIAFREE